MGGRGIREEEEDGRKRKMGGRGRWEEEEDGSIREYGERKRKEVGKHLIFSDGLLVYEYNRVM